MLILLDYMAGGLVVERGGCEGSNGLRGKQGSSPIFLDVFFTNRPQNKPLQVVLQDLYMMS